ncbi:MAG: folate-binding protein [Blastomonas sp.]
MADTRLDDRALIRISPMAENEDVRGFLQGLVTQDMALVLPDTPQWAALLSAQGKTMFDFLLWDDGTGILIDCAADVADALIKRLSLYRLRRKIAIVAEPALAVHWSPDAAERPHDPRLSALGHRWIGAPGNGGDASARWHAHRLGQGVPEGSNELGDILWLECNAMELNGVSFSKGCYVGQENTARMNWRQKVNRRIVVLPLAQSDEKRRRIDYPDLDLAVDHRRSEDLASLAIPGWLRASFALEK